MLSFLLALVEVSARAAKKRFISNHQTHPSSHAHALSQIPCFEGRTAHLSFVAPYVDSLILSYGQSGAVYVPGLMDPSETEVIDLFNDFQE